MRYSDLVMFQEFLYYMLTGKLQGEYIYENIKRDFVNHTVIQKLYILSQETLELIKKCHCLKNIKKISRWCFISTFSMV